MVWVDDIRSCNVFQRVIVITMSYHRMTRTVVICRAQPVLGYPESGGAFRNGLLCYIVAGSNGVEQ